MKIRVHFVRHAEAENNVDPLSQIKLDTLTEKGQRQAIALATYVKELSIDTIYSSKILRAQLTAQTIGQAIEKKPIVIDCVKERKVKYTSSTVYTYEESFESLCLRIVQTKELLEVVPQKHIIVVSHALFIRAFAAYLTFDTQLTEELLERFNDTFLVGNGSISTFEYTPEKKRWRVESWNELAAK